MNSLDFNQLMIIWFSGLIKGAIAFGMSLQISSTLTTKKTYMVSTTLSIVMISTILLGGLVSFFANCIGLSKEKEALFYHIGSQAETSPSNNKTDKRSRLKITAYAYLRSIDELIMRPYFGGATEEDEEREREEELIEEEEHIKIIAEQHLSRLNFENGEYVDHDKQEIIKMSNEFGQFSYQRKSMKSPHLDTPDEEFMDIEIKDIDHSMKKRNSEDDGI